MSQYSRALTQPSVSTPMIALALPPLALAACSRTEAGRAGDREDDVRALADQALGQRLALALGR